MFPKEKGTRVTAKISLASEKKEQHHGVLQILFKYFQDFSIINNFNTVQCRDYFVHEQADKFCIVIWWRWDTTIISNEYT